MFAAIYAADGSDADALVALGRAFSPRLEEHLPRELVLDVDGLSRLFGDARAIGDEIRRSAADKGLRVRVAIAGSRVAARVLVRHRAGVTVVDPDRGTDAMAVADVSIEILAAVAGTVGETMEAARERARADQERVRTLRRWGLHTMGDFAALPPDDVAARLGREGVGWWQAARGEDHHPLVPTVPEECFEQALDLEWPIEGLEPLSFVLGRLFDSLAAQLERRDRGVAVLHVRLHLVTKAVHELSLQLPTPMRDAKALRTLALLSLEGNPPSAGIDRVVVVADPTPARVLQHSLLARPVPLPDEIATLMARLNALMGEGRCGAPAVVDTWKPGAFAVAPFTPDTAPTPPARTISRSHAGATAVLGASARATADRVTMDRATADRATSPALALALRRFRFPVPARVSLERGKPVRVATDRRGMTGGPVDVSAGPWRTSGNWWEAAPAVAASTPVAASASTATATPASSGTVRGALAAWDRDEWDVTLADGTTYRLFNERGTRAWFIDGQFD